MLYPYRASSSKNQVRWQFGVLMPAAYAPARPLRAMLGPGRVPGRSRTVGHHDRPGPLPPAAGARRRGVGTGPGPTVPGSRPWNASRCGVTHVAWDEAVERSIEVGPLALGRLLVAARSMQHRFVSSTAGTETEAVSTARARGRRAVVRRRLPDRPGEGGSGAGRGERRTGADHGGRREHRRPLMRRAGPGRGPRPRPAGPARHGGGGRRAFVSLLDPPEGAAAPAASGCRSDGIYPVLVGDDLVLASPDHPLRPPRRGPREPR